jgi:hypothetical protein
MKFIKTFESYEVDSTCPSREEMISHLCACGYNEAECDEMSMDDLEMQYNECGGGMAYEAKKHRAKAKAKAKAKKKPGMPDFPDVDGDGDTDEPISKANKDKKAAQAGKGHSKADDKKTQSQAQGKLSAAQKKLPPALQKAIAAKRK